MIQRVAAECADVRAGAMYWITPLVLSLLLYCPWANLSYYAQSVTGASFSTIKKEIDQFRYRRTANARADQK